METAPEPSDSKNSVCRLVGLGVRGEVLRHSPHVSGNHRPYLAFPMDTTSDKGAASCKHTFGIV